MSETVKVGRNRPPQNGWASKEEVDKLRAEVAELRETNQMMLEEIKGLRAELGGAKRRHFLGAVATSAAAFFGKFFHRGEDLGNFQDEKEHGNGTKKGAHAKGEKMGNTPFVAPRKNEKPKRSREQEDKRNKSKIPMRRKVVAAIAIVAVAICGGAYALTGNSHKEVQDLPKPTTNTQAFNMNDTLRIPEVEQALAEQKAEADLQNKANEMGMSVESMKRLADEHGMPYDKIGTDEAQHYLSDQLVAKNNIAEPFDASTPEKAKESLSFYVYNHKDVCAEFYAALHENPEGEVDGLENPQDTIDYSEQFKKDDAAFDAARKEVIGALNEDGTEVTVRDATDRDVITFHKIHEEGSDNGTLGVGENKENSNGMNEKVVETNFAKRGIKTLTKVGCAQNAAPLPRVVRVAAATPIHKQEYRQEERRETPPPDKKTPPPNDAKDEHADDPQEEAEDNAKETPRSKDQAGISEDKQVDKNGDGLPDPSGKSKSNNGEYDIDGTQGDDRPANKYSTGAGNGGSGSGEHIAGGGATDTGSGNQGGSGGGGTGSNKADSGGSGKETSQDSQGGGNVASGDIELQSVPITQED
ncbi:hypothetical protein MBO12_02810 [Candidatus Saccharibacteria bacterium]|nr:hypothetical protein [Candidatus Saccharibacteria bacterium]